jgi:hypothetical protein
MSTTVAQWWTTTWQWIVWGNGNLRDVLAYATFFGVMYTVWSFWRSRRLVTVYVVNDDNPKSERREIAKVPVSFVSRAEVVGLVAQVAAGQRLDFSRFRFNYQLRRTVIVRLPQESFEKLGPG